MKVKGLLLALLVFSAAQGVAQEPIGIFDNHVDVGEPAEWGFATYDDGTGRYSVEGPGETIGSESYIDQFHFLYKEISGSFAIECVPEPIQGGRGGLMIRQSLDVDAVHGSLLMTSLEEAGANADIYSVFPTFRTLKGGGTIRDGDPEPGGLTDTHTGRIRVERIGNSIHFYTYDENGDKYFVQTEIVPLEDEVLAGLAVSAEASSGIGYFEFGDVVIEELPLYVSRGLPTEDYEAGAQLSPVTITAQVRDGETVDASVHEVVPSGSVVSNVQADNGDFTLNDDGTIDWTLTGFSGEATLTYDLTLGDGSSAAWQGTFNDGINRESFIGADTVLPKQPVFEERGAIDVDPVLPTLIEAEWGTLTAEEQDFGLMIDPRTQSGITAVAMSGSLNSLLEYTLNIPEDGTYYFFGNVRSEDGNSDSFHAEVDWDPAGDNSSRWNLSSRKGFSAEWLSSSDPALDPRPFELTAGEHWLYIGCREDSASLDWIVVTTNPDMDPAEYVPGQRAQITRSIPPPRSRWKYPFTWRKG